MIYSFKTLRTYVLWGIISLALLPPLVLLTFLPNRFDNRFYFWLTGLYSRLLTGTTFAHVRVRGEENLPPYPQSPAIIVANHSSALDIPLIDGLLGSYPHIWMSKHEYARVPLLGTLLKRMHVLVPRENARKAVAALAQAARQAADGARHIILFPEGTRARDGKLAKFRDGATVLAQKLNRPVIPVHIAGAYEVMPVGKAIDPRASKITLTVGPPMTMEEGEERAAFTARIQSWFTSRSQKCIPAPHPYNTTRPPHKASEGYSGHAVSGAGLRDKEC